ncbi:MAG: Cof-type HAD-IIB family hydrolase [Bacteroidota bacterium]
MNFKLLCTDIDGTLLDKNRQLSALTISEINRIRPKIPVILVSSRMPKAMRHLQATLGIEDTPLIAYNGGLILHGTQVIETTEIDLGTVASILHLTKNTSIHLSLYHNDDWFVPDMDYWAKREQNNTQVSPTVQPLTETMSLLESQQRGVHKIMAMGDENEIEQLFNAAALIHSEELHLYRSKSTYIEIANRSVSKETALSKLLSLKYPEIKLENVVAYGDNYNDIDLLESVGAGIAVANAKQEVLVVSDDITTANVDNGVALSIQKYFK